MNEIFLGSGIVLVLVAIRIIIWSAFRYNPMLGVVIVFFPFLIPVYCVYKYKEALVGLVVLLLAVGLLVLVDYPEFKEDHKGLLYSIDQKIGGSFGLSDPDELPVELSVEDLIPEMPFEPGKIIGQINGKAVAVSRAVLRDGRLLLVSNIGGGESKTAMEVMFDLSDHIESNSPASIRLDVSPGSVNPPQVRLTQLEISANTRDVVVHGKGYHLKLRL